MNMSDSQLSIYDTEISELIPKLSGAVREVESQGFVSGFFLVAKCNGSWRSIINLKALNSFLVHRQAFA